MTPTTHITRKVPTGTGREVARMLCGATCVIHPNGSTTPDEFDFFLANEGAAAATCPECARIWSKELAS